MLSGKLVKINIQLMAGQKTSNRCIFLCSAMKMFWKLKFTTSLSYKIGSALASECTLTCLGSKVMDLHTCLTPLKFIQRQKYRQIETSWHT